MRILASCFNDFVQDVVAVRTVVGEVRYLRVCPALDIRQGAGAGVPTQCRKTSEAIESASTNNTVKSRRVLRSAKRICKMSRLPFPAAMMAGGSAQSIVVL